MAESCSPSTANASRNVSVRESIDALEKWRALPPFERLRTPCPDSALEAVIAYCRHCLDKDTVNSRTSQRLPFAGSKPAPGIKEKGQGQT